MPRLFVLMLALCLLLSGCKAQGPGLLNLSRTPPAPTAVPLARPDPPVWPPPLTEERAAVLYTLFLQEDLTAEQGQYPFSQSYDMDRIKSLFSVRDLTGDGIPELYFEGPGIHEIWSIEEGKVVAIGWLDGYERVLPNGGIFYERLDGAPMWQRYYYTGFSPESKAVPDIALYIYDMDNDGVRETYAIGDKEIPQAEWQEVADIYFALRDAEPTEGQRPVPFLEWAASLDVELPADALTGKKAANLYDAFFTGRVAGYDGAGRQVRLNFTERDGRELYQWVGYDGEGGYTVWEEFPAGAFRQSIYAWDFTGDGIPEAYLLDESRSVWTIEDRHVALLGTLDDMAGQPEELVPLDGWKQTVLGN